jgi:hypothetical protein
MDAKVWYDLVLNNMRIKYKIVPLNDNETLTFTKPVYILFPAAGISEVDELISYLTNSKKQFLKKNHNSLITAKTPLDDPFFNGLCFNNIESDSEWSGYFFT